MAQEKIISQFGLQNGIVGPKEITNTVADMLRLAGVQNADRYFQPVDDAKAQQMMQQAHVSGQPGSAFGKRGENHMRFVFNAPVHEIVEGIEKLGAFLKTVRS